MKTDYLIIFVALFGLLLIAGCAKQPIIAPVDNGIPVNNAPVVVPEQPSTQQSTPVEQNTNQSMTDNTLPPAVTPDNTTVNTTILSNVKLITLQADDFGFNPDTVTVNKGDELRITIIVGTEDKVFNDGLDIRSTGFDGTLQIPTGGNVTIDINATKYFEIQSFQPGTNRYKAGMKFIVQ